MIAEIVRLPLPGHDYLTGIFQPGATANGFVVLWVHGFGSHRGGEKALAVQQECDRRGWAFAAFDFRGHGESSGTMHELCATRLLADLVAIRDWLATRGYRRLGLVGSSMGGFAAAWFTRSYPEQVVGCVFIAPAFAFLQRRWDELTPAERDQWQRTNRRRVVNPWVTAELGFQLVAERERFQPAQLVAAWRTPALLFHGLADDIVPYTESLFFLQNVEYPSVELRLYKDGDHRLTVYKNAISAATGTFFASLLPGES
ncbi:MAG: alpha/beta fold hydrolase [Gemmataceae bacterium]|nr:lysophospholipase [Gemmata sp.]MDW8198879.1 alpha/beta fold hydrolase [Gemmataceae bacterium]